jgi:hypothetical protein
MQLTPSHLFPFESMHVAGATRIEHPDAIDGQALVLRIPHGQGVNYLPIMATAEGLDLSDVPAPR